MPALASCLHIGNGCAQEGWLPCPRDRRRGRILPVGFDAFLDAGEPFSSDGSFASNRPAARSVGGDKLIPNLCPPNSRKTTARNWRSCPASGSRPGSCRPAARSYGLRPAGKISALSRASLAKADSRSLRVILYLMWLRLLVIAPTLDFRDNRGERCLFLRFLLLGWFWIRKETTHGKPKAASVSRRCPEDEAMRGSTLCR
jgi:hypothetical protein